MHLHCKNRMAHNRSILKKNRCGKRKGEGCHNKISQVILHKIYTSKQFIHEKLTSFQQNKKINKNTIAIYNNKYRHV